ncbi:MAG TPA: glycosyltransferase family 4 protein [Candidatus Saccharimonadales bacterium]|nr:glycosyltransferase family 4 protein [Candidatus Saccharimonadales bacterium]
MKILVISSYLPYPLFNGGHVRLYNLIRELSQKHEITLICEKRPFQKDADIDEVKKICKDVITVDRGKQWSISNVLKAGFSTNSFLVTGHTSVALQKKIQETLDKEKFDFIHVETYYVMQNLPKTDVPVVLVEHNIEYQVYERFMERSPIIVRSLLQIDISKIKKEEETFWKNASTLVAVSREDQEIMSKAGLTPHLVSNGVNTHVFTFQPLTFDKNSTKKILFIGDFKWIQNQDTVKFIIKEIWPKIQELRKQNGELGEMKLWIVGRTIPHGVRTLTKDPDVIFDEASSSLSTEKIFHQAAVLLAPIRVGGGTSYKILESMSSGTPVVTMKLSADAIDAKDGENIVVGATADILAQKTVDLLTDQNLYKTITKNGRDLIGKNYTWAEIGKKLEEVYTVTLNKK